MKIVTAVDWSFWNFDSTEMKFLSLLLAEAKAKPQLISQSKFTIYPGMKLANVKYFISIIKLYKCEQLIQNLTFDFLGIYNEKNTENFEASKEFMQIILESIFA